jgi:molybdate transport system ATP-binding protein
MLAVAAARKRGAFALDVRFELPTPGVAALFGRSGSGKSMVVNTIAVLLKPDVGRIVHDGSVLLDTQLKIDVAPECRRMGYVFRMPVFSRICPLPPFCSTQNRAPQAASTSSPKR